MVCIETYKPLIDLLNGLFTPILAIVVAYIAYQQWKTNDRKEKREFREVKISIYKRVKSHLDYTWTTREIKIDLYEDFKFAYAEANFIFPKELNDFLSQINTMSLCWVRDKEDLDCAHPNANQKSIDKKIEDMDLYMDKLQKAHDDLYDQFSTYINE